MKKRVGIGRRVWADGGVVEDDGHGLQNSARPFIGLLPSAKRCVLVEVLFVTSRILVERKSDDLKNTHVKHKFFAYKTTFLAKSPYC
jgi:hypothetical protein